MHISEGVLSPQVLASGAALAVIGVGLGLRALKNERLVTACLLSSAFFVGSLVHVPLGPGNVHLILSGLLGLILGVAAFPAVFAALLLQAVLFGFGGLTTLGVNTFTMAAPAILFAWAFAPLVRKGGKSRLLGAFLTGSLAIAGSSLLTALALAFTDEGFLLSAKLLVLAHVPVMIIEGLLCALAVSFLARVRPELLELFDGRGTRPEGPASLSVQAS